MDVHAVQGGMVLNPEVVVEFGSPPLRKGFGMSEDDMIKEDFPQPHALIQANLSGLQCAMVSANLFLALSS